jgi:class 3 adenylate cyclase/tetratricopeptide (TPR) repeat protein
MDVRTWLDDLGLSEFAESFAENGVDAAMLSELTNDDLKDLGVARLVDRKRLVKAIEELAAPAKPPVASPNQPALGGERRQVTVLFADLTGFTKLSNELGAERTHTLLNHYFETVDAIVENYGGRIDKHIGDSVMAVFGAPVAHTNDPERAVRAALDIHEAMKRLGAKWERDLSAHIGIASGQVVASGTGSDAHREYTVTGDTVNLASRLEDAAEPGETLISDAISDVVGHLAHCAPRGEVAIKGFPTPVSIWAVTALREGSGNLQLAQFVGRGVELRQFSAGLEACREGGGGHAILIRGEPGIGKSRLVHEFSGIARGLGYSIHTGLILDFGVGKGRDAIRALARSLLALPPGSGKDFRRAAADNAVAQGHVDREDLLFLDDLLDLPQPEDRLAVYRAMDNETRSQGRHAVVSTLVAARAEVGPCLIVIEDIHWADDVTAAYLPSLLEVVSNCRAVLILTSRVEGRAMDPMWLAGMRACPITTVDLQSLRPEEAVGLARSLAPDRAGLIQRCIDRSGGNPLFLEQLMRNASDQVEEDLPDTLHAVVMARVDRLGRRDREALQAAAILGQRFPIDILRDLIDDPNYDCASLVQHRLVRQDSSEYQFSHALIRDGVYASLLSDSRRRLHAKAAEAFAESDLVLQAEHLDRAEDPLAAGAYLTAAKAQTALFHFERAAVLAKRGIEVATVRETKVQLFLALGEILHDKGDNSGGMAAFREALNLAEEDRERCTALIGLASMMRLTDELRGALELLDEAQPLAEANDLALELAELHHLRGNLYFPLGRTEDCFRQHEIAVNYARRAGSTEMEVRALGGLGDAEYARGRMVTAHEYVTECIRLSREHGYARTEAANLNMLGGGGTNFYLNNLRAGLEACHAGIEKATQIGHIRAAVLSHVGAAQICCDMADWINANHHAAAIQELSERIGTRRFVARALHRQGVLKRVAGDNSAAVELFTEAIAISRETGIGYCGPLIFAALARAVSDPSEREAALSEGEALMAKGCVSHNYFEFYEEGMELMLELGDWDGLERYARALEDYTKEEPLPRSDFFIARARALGAFRAGDRSLGLRTKIEGLRDQAQRCELNAARDALDGAMAVA